MSVMCLYLCMCMVGGSVLGVFAFVYVYGGVVVEGEL